MKSATLLTTSSVYKAAALPKHQEEEETGKTKQAQIEQRRKALRLGLSSRSEVIVMLKELKNTRTK